MVKVTDLIPDIEVSNDRMRRAISERMEIQILWAKSHGADILVRNRDATDEGTYIVHVENRDGKANTVSCSCPDWVHRHEQEGYEFCKHQYRVGLIRDDE